MKKIIIGIVIVCLYCFPFVYHSMNEDFANGSMFGYLFMIIATSLLAYLGTRVSHLLVPIIGNVVSAIVSYYFVGEMMGDDRWGGYFKPLTPYQLFILVSVLNIIPQLFAMRSANRNKD